MTAGAGAGRRMIAWPWVGLAAVVVVLLIWWWSPITRSSVVPAALIPFVLPVLLLVRAGLPYPRLGSALSGLVLGLSLFGATGRGAVFLVVGLAASALELRWHPHLRPVEVVVLVGVGALAGVVALAMLPSA